MNTVYLSLISFFLNLLPPSLSSSLSLPPSLPPSHLQINVIEAIGLPEEYCHYVFCQYRFRNQVEAMIIPTLVQSGPEKLPHGVQKFEHSQVGIYLLCTYAMYIICKTLEQTYMHTLSYTSFHFETPNLNLSLNLNNLLAFSPLLDIHT